MAAADFTLKAGDDHSRVTVRSRRRSGPRFDQRHFDSSSGNISSVSGDCSFQRSVMHIRRFMLWTTKMKMEMDCYLTTWIVNQENGSSTYYQLCKGEELNRQLFHEKKKSRNTRQRFISRLRSALYVETKPDLTMCVNT